MWTKNAKILTVSGILSAVVTLGSGFLRVTPNGLVGASWYGYPMGWLIRLVIAPQYNPWKVLSANLVMDLIFWFVIFAVIITIACKAKGEGKKKSTRRR
jgi:hypothetical protein